MGIDPGQGVDGAAHGPGWKDPTVDHLAERAAGADGENNLPAFLRGSRQARQLKNIFSR